ncbi:glycosyltransferase family 25 protein [Vibrio sp. Of7-15]|uniref:glycosyltransferase family 25 protein n=1 Tax=Vibrio sp. Of7-15 TaxID=2724879 RepID=UPI001EF1C543|nr:glycosyltransferase family 25 protein [Vibrio sp. Of7-15]MCG7496814.1 glycosyltransferase family 25 protein [Vibrio sp. Of7-15]
MKAFVLTLKGCDERQQLTTDILHSASVDFEFLYGVDGRKGEHPLLKRYNDKEFQFNCGRPAALGEIGCYASHYLAWQKCVELNEPILVFEDDLSIEDGFHSSIDYCSELIKKHGFIRMESTETNNKYYTVNKSDHFSLIKYLKVPQCATCYAISPQVAKTFIKHSQSFNYPVDVFIRNTWIHHQPIFAVQPALLYGGELESVIGDRHRTGRKNYVVAVMKIVRKIRSMIMNGIRNLIHYPSWPIAK